MDKIEFPAKKEWLEWRKRKPAEYGKNKVMATVRQVEPFAADFRLAYPAEWEPWKCRRCDAGFDPGQELVFEEGKKLTKGKIYCFSAINEIIPWIWGRTYDSWFPWDYRTKGMHAYTKKTKEERKIHWGYCPDVNNTVAFDIKKIEKE